MQSDVALSEPVTLTKDTLIDLNGHSIEGSASSALFVADGVQLTFDGSGDSTISNPKMIAEAVNGGTIIIEDGNFVTQHEGFRARGNGSSIVMNYGHLNTQETALSIQQGASLEFNDGWIKTVDNFGIATNGTPGLGGNTIVMNDGVIEANITSDGWEACGIYIANSDNFVMNGGAIRVNNGCGICQRGGSVTIHDGTITATGLPGTTGKVGDGKYQMGKSGIIFHQQATNYPDQANMRLVIDGGSITGVEHAVEILSDAAEPNVSVTGGTFSPPYPEVAGG